MVMKEIEQAGCTENIYLCDSCGNPTDDPVGYYSENSVGGVITSADLDLQSLKRQIIDDICDTFDERRHPTFRRANEIPRRTIHQKEYNGAEVCDITTAIVHSRLDKAIKTDNIKPTFQFCDECKGGVEDNVKFINTYINKEPDEPPDFFDEHTDTIRGVSYIMSVIMGVLAIGAMFAGMGFTIVSLYLLSMIVSCAVYIYFSP